jgi:hypothetical protein
MENPHVQQVVLIVVYITQVISELSTPKAFMMGH